MLIVVPELAELGKLEASMTPQWLQALRAEAKPTHHYVALPRFTIAPKAVALTDVLTRLGMRSAFEPAADFSGISRTAKEDGLFLGGAHHRAFVSVTEKGTEAAAAGSAESEEFGSLPFAADRPFLFFIVDDASTILFLGRVLDPSSK